MFRIEELIKEKKYTGNYGGSNSSYYALAECVYQKDIVRNKTDIHINPININPNEDWKQICTFNPFGMNRPELY